MKTSSKFSLFRLLLFIGLLFPGARAWAQSDLHISELQKKLEKAKLFHEDNASDSALFYFKQCYEDGKRQERSEELQEACYFLGEIYYYSARYDRSIEVLEELLALQKQEKDTLEWLNTLNSISICLEEQGKYEESIAISKEGYEIALQVNDVDAAARCLNNLGLVYRSMGKTKEALSIFWEAHDLAEREGNEVYQAVFLQNVGIIHSRSQQHVEALKIYFQALEMFEKAEDPMGVAEIQFNIGLIYKKNGEYRKAIKYYQKSLTYDSTQSDTMGIIFDYQNIGNAYAGLGEVEQAEYYLRGAYQLLNQSDGACYDGEAGALGALFYRMGKVDSALVYLQQEYESAKRCDNWLNAPASLYLLGEISKEQGDLPKAFQYYTEGFELAQKMELNEDVRDLAQALYQWYKREGQSEKALYYNEIYHSTNDSIYNLKNTRELTWLQANYKMDRVADSLNFEKEQEANAYSHELERQERWFTSVVVFLIGLLLLITIGYLYFRNRRKLRFQEELSQEKDRGLKAIIDAQEEERKRISKDLHDGIGQQLSGLKMAWGSFASSLSGTDQEKVKELTSILDDSANEVRSISHQMMPRALQELGLAPALEDMLEKTFKFSKIQYSFEQFKAEERFDERVEVSLYRVCQELINNVVKHSEASEVAVQLIRSGKYLSLIVEDNGKGMTPNHSESGHGLQNIATRLGVVQGEVSYQPSMQSGTLATVRIPLD